MCGRSDASESAKICATSALSSAFMRATIRVLCTRTSKFVFVVRPDFGEAERFDPRLDDFILSRLNLRPIEKALVVPHADSSEVSGPHRQNLARRGVVHRQL